MQKQTENVRLEGVVIVPDPNVEPRKEEVDADGHSIKGPCAKCVGWH